MHLTASELPKGPAPRARRRPATGGDGFVRAPLSETLRVLEPHLPPALAGPRARAALRTALAQIPAAVTDELYLECRLGPEEARVDAVLHVREPGREILAGVNRAIPLPPPLADRPGWARLRRFCGEWADPRSIFHRAASSLWVELDLEGGQPHLDEPGTFVDLSWLSLRGAGPAEWTAHAAAAGARLCGRPPPSGAIRAVRRCMEALPAGARMIYAGFFPGRGDGAIRVCAAGVGAGALEGYLGRAGWPGDPAPVVHALGGDVEHGPGAVPGYVHLDAQDGGAGARLGVEVPLHRRAQLEGGIRETEWLRALPGAAAEKVAALEAWPGWTATVLPHQPWRSLLVRRVNHVKLVFQDGCPAQPKAYLAARHTARVNREGEEV